MIELHNITKVHHRGETEVHALHGATGSIGEGEFAFLLGPSGSGKSTLLHLIGALDEPTAGEIEVAGRKLSAMSATERDTYRRSDVGFIFQNFNLLKNLDAIENVLVPFLPTGVAPELRKRAIALAGTGGSRKPVDASPEPSLRRRAAACGDRPGVAQTPQADPG